MELQDLKNNIEMGEQIFENLAPDIRPGWAGFVLFQFDRYIKETPPPVKALFAIIESKDNWHRAHEQFTEIRRFLLGHKSYRPEAYLLLAELVAKVTYNASYQPTLFDKDSGHYIASTALKAAAYLSNKRLEEDIIAAIVLFEANTKFKDNLSAAKDLLLYKKIDYILWYDWDPIGVNDFDARDEYHSYVPEIFDLVKAGTSHEVIAGRLFNIQTERMQMPGTIEKCLIVARKIATG